MECADRNNGTHWHTVFELIFLIYQSKTIELMVFFYVQAANFSCISTSYLQIVMIILLSSSRLIITTILLDLRQPTCREEIF